MWIIKKTSNVILRQLCSMIANWKHLFINIVLLIQFGTSTVNAQTINSKTSFDSIYNHIATALSAKDNNEAILAAETLLKKAEDSLQKLRSIMLLATLHE